LSCWSGAPTCDDAEVGQVAPVSPTASLRVAVTSNTLHVGGAERQRVLLRGTGIQAYRVSALLGGLPDLASITVNR